MTSLYKFYLLIQCFTSSTFNKSLPEEAKLIEPVIDFNQIKMVINEADATPLAY